MSFLTLAALAVGLLVAAPIVAHLLRRKPPEEVAFTAVDLVPATTATAQRRNALEDRALFFVRAIAVLALAILGATPFVTCQRLSLARDGGASVAIAIVLDDSMSMQAATPGETVSRFDRAPEGARGLLAGRREGDAGAVVLARAPPRGDHPATTNH
ncbi:MAG: BatA domain-containing protein, partial [Myxococcota bacterium]